MTKRVFEQADLFRFQYITEAQLDPQGRTVVYTLMRTDEGRDQEFSNLWLHDLETGSAFQLTFGDWADYAPVWSPDGSAIAFLSSRDGKPQIYRLSLRGGEAQRLTTLEQGCAGALVWSPDGSKLAFTAGRTQPCDLTKPYTIHRTIYRFDGIGFVENFVKNLYVLDLASGQVGQLTHDDWNHTPLSWSPDGAEVLMLAGMNPDSLYPTSSLVAVNSAGEQRTVLSSAWGGIQNAVWLHDGRIAFAGVPEGKLYGSKGDLWVMNADGSAIECRTTSLANGISGRMHDDLPVFWNLNAPAILPAAGQPDAVVSVQQGGEIHLMAVALQGAESIRTLTSGERTCLALGRSGNKVAFGISTLFDPTQLAVLSLADGTETRLTDLNRTLLDSIIMPELRHITCTSSDGASVEGWILLPQGEAPFPTVLHIHGGPHAGYGHAFHFDYHILAGAGYAVLFLNHRGSTGYGDTFATIINCDWGHLDYDDLMAGVDEGIRLGLVDGDRLGCTGISGGGYLSCWIVGQTRRFKAAVPEAAVTNFVSFYGTSDIGPMFAPRELGGKPFETPEIYTRCSPITYAHHCTTPTLLIVGEADYRCPAEQSEQFFTTLKANGCTTALLRLPNSSHNDTAMGPFASRRERNRAVVEWMNRYVRGVEA